jgi:ubiquitin-like 1-activating enzyme E1 A
LLIKNENYYAPFDIVIACDHDFMTLSMINTAARFASRPFYAAGIHGFYGYIFADLFGHEFVVEREKSNRATAIGPESVTRSVLSVTTKKESKDGGGEKTVEIVKKQEIYCPLILANSSPLPMDVVSSRRKLKAVPALLPCLRALFDFQRSYGQLPVISNTQHLRDFTNLATNKSRELQLPPETLRAEFLRSFIQNIGAEIVPTAAFVGGRLSEDVINVLGKREQPIQNFALFDGDSLEGRIYSLYSPPPEATLPIGMDMGMPMNGMMDPMAAGMGGMGVMMMDNGMMDASGMAGFGMMPDAGMMDASGMVGFSNGMDGSLGGMAGAVDMGPGNGAAEVSSSDTAVDSGTEINAQDPPRSVPADEAGGSGS